MEQIILEFFERFRSDLTESIYAAKGIQDYQRLKTFYDYLDFDRETIFRDKKDNLHCGLRNIGNTCYLNVLLQVLYHINFLRQKIFAHDASKSRILQELKSLFGIMQLGKLTYADPTDLFEQLKKKHPQVFIEGVQNDFHQICTILLDQLKECFKASQNDSKVIEKILFGKLAIKTFHSEGKNIRNTRFNIINLDVSYDTLENALEHWKNYEIEDYMTENKKTVKASVQTQFIETPALLTFFINRVSFKENKLYKDNREFKFENFIQLEKSSSNTQNDIKPAKNFARKQEQLIQQKQKLTIWIQKIENKKEILRQTLKYLEEKEFTNINLPIIENKFEQSSKIKEFLDEQVKLIEAKITDSQKEILSLENKISRLYEESQVELYSLLAMMIHEGSDPNYGHYKVIFLTETNQWVEFNDRKVEYITDQKVEAYRKKGQICCLFYKRPSLVCTDKKVPITGSLKSKVQEIERKIVLEIDKARVLQNLYQLSESSGYLVDQQMRDYKQNQWCYFFKPVLHCMQEKYTFAQCQGVLTYENLKDPNNIAKLQSSFLSDKQFEIPDLNLQLPVEYFKYSQVFEKFLKRQLILEFVGQAYEWLAENISIPAKNRTVLKWIEKYLEVIVMKGVFYLCVLYRASPSPFIEAKFMKLFSSLEKIIRKLDVTSNFVLTFIPIKDEIQRLFYQQINNPSLRKNESTKILRPTSNSIISKLLSQSSSQLFKHQFGYWIIQRNKVLEIDESLIKNEIQEHNKYLIQLA